MNNRRTESSPGARPVLASILLVEDSPSDAFLTRRALTRGGIADSLHHEADGVKALDWLFGEGESRRRTPPPRLILLDLKMPRVDGLEVLRRIRAEKRTRNVPAIMLTSSGEERDLRACYDSGANSYVVKPVVFDEYMEKVALTARYWLRVNEAAPSVQALDLLDSGDVLFDRRDEALDK